MPWRSASALGIVTWSLVVTFAIVLAPGNYVSLVNTRLLVGAFLELGRVEKGVLFFSYAAAAEAAADSS
jgi:hypothetical protein